jgi:hypothetical protein
MLARNPPPQAPTLSSSQQSLLRQMSLQQAHSRSQSDLLQHSANQMTPALGFARPLPHNAQAQFTSMDSFHITPELIAEINQAHSLGAGMSGVAYAGGISSGPVSRSAQLEPSSLPKESSLERAHSGERPNPRELSGGSNGVQRRDTASRDKVRDSWELHRHSSMKRDPPQGIPAQQHSPQLEAQRTESPQYLTGNHPTPYNPSDRKLQSAQAAALPPSPPSVHQNVPYTEPHRSTPPSVTKLSTQSYNERPSIELKISSSGVKITNAVVVDLVSQPLYSISSRLEEHKTALAQGQYHGCHHRLGTPESMHGFPWEKAQVPQVAAVCWT